MKWGGAVTPDAGPLATVDGYGTWCHRTSTGNGRRYVLHPRPRGEDRAWCFTLEFMVAAKYHRVCSSTHRRAMPIAADCNRTALVWLRAWPRGSDGSGSADRNAHYTGEPPCLVPLCVGPRTRLAISTRRRGHPIQAFQAAADRSPAVSGRVPAPGRGLSFSSRFETGIASTGDATGGGA